MSEQSLAVVNPLFISPVADMRTAIMAYQNMKDFVSGVLRENVDFGAIPGTDKPTLLKPGAEKLSRFFGLFIQLEELVRTEDWTGQDHGGEAFFFYRYKAKAMRGDAIVAEGIGSCSSWEKKYRYRKADRVCPECGEMAIIKGKQEYGGGWLCFKKKGGCGAKFQDKDPVITDQETGQIVNPDPADLVNTIDKMAQKRAIIASVLLACNASEYFTQDMEDYTDATFTVEKVTQQPEQVEQEDKPPVTVNKPTASMTLETALEMTNSDGELLVKIETKTLAGMANSLTKGLKEGKYENAEDRQMELDAIALILASRR